MAIKDLHDKPFDEVTLTKLEIFEDYAEAWIPVFVMLPKIKEIHIFDFFAGTGYDKDEIPGSPIRLLQKVKTHQEIILKNNINIKLHFNEYKAKKFESLKFGCEDFLNQNSHLKKNIEINYYNLDFKVCFDKLYPVIQKYPSLVYLDQNGIKYFELDFIKKLENSGQTDFLYFVSSSYFWRFGETEEFQSHLQVNTEEIKKIRINLFIRLY